MAELSRRSGLSVPTIKYYLREGLLQPGRRTSVNQARYDDAHLERLRLIRALVKVAGLPLDKVREVVQAVSIESSVLDAMGVTQDALVGDVGAVQARRLRYSYSRSSSPRAVGDARRGRPRTPQRFRR